jgi:flagellar hook assembly protein FlgD
LRLSFRPLGGAARVTLSQTFDAALEGPAEAIVSPFYAETGLTAVGPVPSRGSVEIAFSVARTGADVDVRIVDVAGRDVRVLDAGPGAAGRQRVVWDGRDGRGMPAAAGIYFVRLQVEERTWTRKILLLR